ncbi:pimeloyl-ACP methyl ester carboxylesterase [Nitrospirillum viridazoti]|uniref:Alpha/beta hydrolase n=1 Tax=Nitrospirillum viridazoti CBAmc TaxID=1441467 RepID=A0A248K3K4_9PROT|nr:alpha/beta hydrolase [Nitrospirillum amazonense CBAmc]TWB31228.1 pimeloyl-ACP methyl ester carboxylesterase [Nitrospirillum amazonense]
MNSEATNADSLSGPHFLQVGDVRLELLVKGEGRPLLLLHGMDGIEAMAPLVDLLAATHKVYAPSHPGFGGSDLPRSFSTVDDIAYFYLDLLDQLDLRDVLVAGFSFGGWIAAEMLVKNSGRLALAVLGAPFGIETAHRKDRRVVDIFMCDGGTVERKSQVTPAQKLDLAALPEDVLERRVRNAEATMLYGWSPYMCNPKLRHRLHRVATPTLLLWGEDDAIAPLDYGRDYAALIPQAVFEAIPNCGHRIYVDSVEAAARSINTFAQRAVAAAA